MQDAFALCEAEVRDADKDRYLATLFAPGKSRRQLYALYAFNAEVARISDRVHEPLAGEMRLQWWRDALEGRGAGEARSHPTAAALIDTIIRARLPIDAFIELIDARSFDIYAEPMQTLGDLEAYARRTSSNLMMLAARILGDDGRQTAELIEHSGISFALTGLLRSFAFHAVRGRIYVPLQVLAQHGAHPEDVLRGQDSAPLRGALRAIRAEARRHYDHAHQLSRGAPQDIVPALLPVALVPLYLTRMGRGNDPFSAAVDVPQWRRQWMLWRAARKGVI